MNALGEVWLVVITGEPRPECGHRQAQLLAVCERTGNETAEQVALRMCNQGDPSFLIGPFPTNALVPTAPYHEWPGSYRPFQAQSSDPQTPEKGGEDASAGPDNRVVLGSATGE